MISATSQVPIRVQLCHFYQDSPEIMHWGSPSETTRSWNPGTPPSTTHSSPNKMLQLDEGSVRGSQEASQHSDTDAAAFGWLTEAWAKGPMLRSLKLPIPKARMPCLALRCDENGRCSARTFRGTELGAEIAIKPGSHSFVRVPGEDFVRTSKVSFLFGTASGHVMLSDEKPMLSAGEIEISEDSQLIRWNNVSGTYRYESNRVRAHANFA